MASDPEDTNTESTVRQSTILMSVTQVNQSDADVVFKSSDGVLFSLHKKNLDLNTGGFPSADFKDNNEVIELTEESDVLELLFQFVYPRQPPILSYLPFETVNALAQAAEKYVVYPAIGVCRAYMLYLASRYKPANAKEIVKYAAEHSYMEILDEAVVYIASEPLESSVSFFPPALQLPWALYRDQWIRIFDDAKFRLADHWNCCYRRNACEMSKHGSSHAATERLELADLMDMNFDDSLFCRNCNCEIIREWKKSIEGQAYGLRVPDPDSNNIIKYNPYFTMVSDSDESSTKWSEMFHKSDADVTFKSSDGVLFALHKIKLDLNTGGFPTVDFKSEYDEVIDLPETSAVLDLLFQFIYPQPPPGLSNVSFETINALALVAEKYIVYSAMGACRQHMLYRAKCGPDNITNIVKYAADNGYIDIIDEAAVYLASEELEDSISLFPSALQGPWESMDEDLP
ncbi:hypothetical protein BDQ17DRAFT_1339490 [Cyathus striatus]|nr:hypothetical protein BDQ17DRAFT_1339490 [Cyathus striatus]